MQARAWKCAWWSPAFSKVIGHRLATLQRKDYVPATLSKDYSIKTVFVSKNFVLRMKSGMTYTLFSNFCIAFTFENIIILPSFQYTYNKSFITSNREIYGHCHE